MDFAGYAFNKSHAACYAIVGYFTAYLKYYYPAEYMSALLNSYLGQLDQAAHYIQKTKEMGIDIFPPSINKSDAKFKPEGNGIRIGLKTIKFVGNQAISDLILDRKQNGEFTSFGDFLRRAQKQSLNKKMIESLIAASALDEFRDCRNEMIAATEPFLHELQKRTQTTMSGQLSIFDLQEDPAEKDQFNEPTYPTVKKETKRERLQMEKQAMGVYVTGHPLNEKVALFSKKEILSSKQFMLQFDMETPIEKEDKLEDRQYVLMGGLIQKRTDKYTKKQDKMSFLTVEDFGGSYEIICFPKVFSEYESILIENNIIFAKGRLSFQNDNEIKLIAENIMSIEEMERYFSTNSINSTNSMQKTKEISEPIKETKHSTDRIKVDQIKNSQPKLHQADCVNKKALILAMDQAMSTKKLNQLKSTITYFSGDIPVYLYIKNKKELIALPSEYKIVNHPFVLKTLLHRYGDKNVRFMETAYLKNLQNNTK